MATVHVDVDAFRTVLADLTPRRFSRAINISIDFLADEALRLFQQATSTWEHQPDFRVYKVKKPSHGEAYFTVVTIDPVFKWVDEGVPAHTLRAKKRKPMKFYSGFTPKTVPYSLTPGPGERSGELIFTTVIIHPGIEPRFISETVTAEVGESINDVVLEQIDAAWARQTSFIAKMNRRIGHAKIG